MKKIQLYGTNLTVSRLCMGTVNFGATLNQQQVNDHLDQFIRLGGNFIDSAHVYSNWIPGEKSRSERMIGRWLQTHSREKIIICTKGGHYDFALPNVSRVTPEEISIDLNESLSCLQTDYIDIYMLHRDNPALPVSEIMDCLHEFVLNGKVRYLACSNWTAKRTAQANAYAKANGKTPFVVNELLWSLAKPNRETLPPSYVTMDEEMLQLGIDQKLNFMCFSALAKGYFTRRFAGRSLSDGLHRTYDNAENEMLYERLSKMQSAEAVTHASLQYFEHQPVPAIPIVTFSNMDQLKECARAFAEEVSLCTEHIPV